jgi:hypothetical protein
MVAGDRGIRARRIRCAQVRRDGRRQNTRYRRCEPRDRGSIGRGRRSGGLSSRDLSLLLHSPQEPCASASAAGKHDRGGRLAACPASRPAIAEAPTTRPNRIRRGKPTRTTAITTGITRCFGARTSRTSVSRAGPYLGQRPFQRARPQRRRRAFRCRAARRRQQGDRAQELPQCPICATSRFSRLGTSALLLTGVDNLTIDNLKIDTDRDGIDIDCCQNVRVSNCTVNSPWDDGICPKSSLPWAMPGRREM